MSAAGKIREVTGATSGPLALHLLGILRAHEGRYDEAEEAFLGAVEAEPEMVGSYVELGLVYACRGEYRKMTEALRRSVAVGSSGVRVYLGERPLGDFPTDAASTKASGDGLPTLVTAIAYLAYGRDAEAADMLEQALGSHASSPPLFVALLSLAYLLQGKAVEADDAGVRRGESLRKGRAYDR